MSSTAKKGRGISRQISKWGKEKIHIEFDAEGQPVGEMATKLETQLGVMVRSIAPLHLLIGGHLGWNHIRSASGKRSW